MPTIRFLVNSQGKVRSISDNLEGLDNRIKDKIHRVVGIVVRMAYKRTQHPSTPPPLRFAT